MWTLASGNLTCDFIKTGLHHGHIIAECSDFLWGGGEQAISQNCSDYL